VRNGFTGHRHDDELRLINMRGRVYDLARGISSRDPFAILDENPYSYVRHDPLNWLDPSGFSPEKPWYEDVFGFIDSNPDPVPVAIA
jgi:RHS repeat-associated protein